IDLYAGRPETDDPVAQEAERRRRHASAERELLDALPRAQRPAARLVLRFARERLPMRGVGKRAFLQALDVARASGRGLGRELARTGVLDDPEDFAYLTANELVEPPADARELVAERRRTREEQRLVERPIDWQGKPRPVPAADSAGNESLSPNGVVAGLGVSGGVAEGIARIVTDPTFAEVEPDEVLVAETTDPSWSSIMFVSSALVMDSGGALS